MMRFLPPSSLPWLLATLLVLALMPWTGANAQSCGATLSFSDVGAEQQDNFSSCSTALQPSSDHQDNSSPRWSGLQTSMGASVRGPFACGAGSAVGCATPQATTLGDANATFQVTTNLQTGVATFKLLSRARTDAFTVSITLYTFVGAPDAPVASSKTNTAYTYTMSVAGTGAPLDLTARALTDGRVGTAYNEQLSATGGSPPYQFTYSGTLPAGLSLSTTGLISGLPTTVESQTFSVTVRDASSSTAARTFSITVRESAPAAQNSSASLAANSGSTVMPLTVGGGAPTSITILQDVQHGALAITGTSVTYTPTPGYSGADYFTYRASNSAGHSDARVDIDVRPPQLALSPAAGSLTGATVGTPYALTLTAANGTAPYSFAFVGPSPPWLQLAGTGQLTGTPSAAGTPSFTVRATDRYGATGDATYSLRVAGLAPIASPVNVSVDANVASVIPPNLTGGAATTLYIVGQPAHGTLSVDGLQFRYTPSAGYSGPDTFLYAADNADGRSQDATVTISVRAPAFTFTPATGDLAAAVAGQAYAGATIQASGGGAPYRYTVGTGALPAGLNLDRDTGVISGTPTSATSASFTVVATDRHGATDSVSYRIVVGSPAPTAGDVTATIPANSPGTPITLQLGGGSATAIVIVTPPSHGNAVVSGTAVQYTPQPGYSGADLFTYLARNASGDSPTATVRLTIAPPALSFTPAAGALPAATTGSPYAQTLTASGGTAPYRYAVTGALPPGIALTGNILTGTPTEAGDWRFAVSATDALGASTTAVYTLSTGGAAPIASDHAVQLLAGTRVTIDLATLASGGPFTAATIVAAPPADAGTAQISTPWKLVYTAAPNASGPVVLRYTVSNAWKTSAPATLTFNVLARPDPSKDAEVIGLVTAQVRSAERFATTQIGNFGSRLENLHDESSRHAQPLGLRFAQAGNATRPGQPIPSGFDAVFPAAATFGAPPAAPLAAADGRADRATPRGPLAFWTGGYVNFGSGRASSTRIEHTLVGVSLGADYRISPDLVAGMGVGYGREISDIGSNGTRSTGTALSAAFYGSYHPAPYFVDALLGITRLDFDSRRHVTGTDEQARGNRDGSQLFGSLAVGYEYRQDAVLISPYGRLQGAWTRLNGYTESGASVYSLQFSQQRTSLFSSVFGLRGEHSSAMRWGTLSMRGRVEFSHDLSGDSSARMGYADLGGQPYQLDVIGLSRNALSLELGVQGALYSGQTLAVAYRTGIGFSDRQRDNSVMVRFSHRY
ncbi:autotransporter domain-containing protein [Achromobacter insuavis]|nr:autotransporter domain-containing protein [Achromobacter insuavis]